MSAIALAAITIIAVKTTIKADAIDRLKRIVKGDSRSLQIAYKVYKNKSTDECVMIVNNALDGDQKIAAIANLLDLTMVDGTLTTAEKRIIESYIMVFQINEAVIQNIIEVIAIKNDFSIFS
ncbi:hypothetical protein BST81_03180 [Leptolyngbya sp. 'hensonii']|nr:hypothetical protein BST81_03180 [Leptolyngbya sp. 'hensonii']